jgi:ABC-type Zn uptake system ZnuABC Zn-binding protein ZnuA
MCRNKLFGLVSWLIAILWMTSACAPGAAPSPAPVADEPMLRVLAVETFLADIAQNVAGDRLQVAALMPIGVDPHSFEPTPQDVARVADSDVLIVNGAGFEAFLDELLQNAGGQRQVIEAAAGLAPRTPQGEELGEEHQDEAEDEHGHEGDPHFWLDPKNAIQYVENIRAGLSQSDPDAASVYAANAQAYIAQLEELDKWITEQVQQVPPERRLLVTNHESFGYFADRYGFKIIGTIVPSISPTAAPSAQQLAELIDHIKATGAPAIFLETGTSPQLAHQVAAETNVKVVTELYSHSITAADGLAPTYIDMIKYNTMAIVGALK